MKEEIIVKIKKLLALSKSSNLNESQNAMLMAQRLMLKHKIAMREVEAHTDIKLGSETTSIRFRVAKWKSSLARVIAENFGTRMYYPNCVAGSKGIGFFGKEEDVTICVIMMEYAVKCIESSSEKYIKELKRDKRRKRFDGIKSDYALGFVQGLKERFEDQISKNNEWGIILKRDPIVDSKYEDFSKGFGNLSIKQSYNNNDEAFLLGVEEGKNFDISDKIEKEGEENNLIIDLKGGNK